VEAIENGWKNFYQESELAILPSPHTIAKRQPMAFMLCIAVPVS
jgi:hypothetical protein